MDFAIALACFVLLVSWRLPPLIVVVLGALRRWYGAALGRLARRQGSILTAALPLGTQPVALTQTRYSCFSFMDTV